MAYLDVDFGIPMAILAASIAGTILVRIAAAVGERRARERTLRLIGEIGIDTEKPLEKGGMRRHERTSTG